MCITENQEIDVIEDLKTERAYKNDESYEKEVEQYFRPECYQNQDYYKTHQNTYYDVLRYTQELRTRETSENSNT